MSDAPKPGVIYQLTGGSNEACISNGNSWQESQVVPNVPRREQILAKIDKDKWRGFTIGTLRKVFEKYENNARWKNPFQATVENAEEAKVLIAAIRFFHGAEPIVTTQGRTTLVKSPGYQCD